MQNSLVVYCKKNSRELHRVKSEEVKRQTAKRIGKNRSRDRGKWVGVVVLGSGRFVLFY